MRVTCLRRIKWRHFRWNETDASKFCSDLVPNTTKTANPRPKCSLHTSLLDTVRKYVFFATDRTVVGKYTDQGGEINNVVTCETSEAFECNSPYPTLGSTLSLTRIFTTPKCVCYESAMIGCQLQCL